MRERKIIIRRNFTIEIIQFNLYSCFFLLIFVFAIVMMMMLNSAQKTGLRLRCEIEHLFSPKMIRFSQFRYFLFRKWELTVFFL